jgi:hypothetical protein
MEAGIESWRIAVLEILEVAEERCAASQNLLTEVFPEER